MFDIGITIISAALILGGLIFFLGAAVGIIRFPDFYTRMHAAGKGDTLSSLMILLGLALYQFHDVTKTHEFHALTDQFTWENLLGFFHVLRIELFVAIKILAISVFIMLTSPTSTHALSEAGHDDGMIPYINHDGAKEKPNPNEEPA